MGCTQSQLAVDPNTIDSTKGASSNQQIHYEIPVKTNNALEEKPVLPNIGANSGSSLERKKPVAFDVQVNGEPNAKLPKLDATKAKQARAKSAARRADPETLRRQQEEREQAVAANRQRELDAMQAKQKEREDRAKLVLERKARGEPDAGANADNEQGSMEWGGETRKSTSIAAIS